MINKYQKLKTFPKGQSLEKWPRQWEKSYDECAKLKILDIDGGRPLKDFLNAVSSITSGLAGSWKGTTRKERREERRVRSLTSIS
jgi:hypothetical protein